MKKLLLIAFLIADVASANPDSRLFKRAQSAYSNDNCPLASILLEIYKWDYASYLQKNESIRKEVESALEFCQTDDRSSFIIKAHVPDDAESPVTTEVIATAENMELWTISEGAMDDDAAAVKFMEIFGAPDYSEVVVIDRKGFEDLLERAGEEAIMIDEKVIEKFEGLK